MINNRIVQLSPSPLLDMSSSRSRDSNHAVNGQQQQLQPKTPIEKIQESFLNFEGETLSFSSPPLTLQSIKEKSLTKAKKWDWKGFRNSSRQDALVLPHWSKSTDKKSDDYQYARFNKKMEILMYNEEEYDLYLRDDNNWTKEDTDQLLELCKRFDTRFILVADRFEGSVPKTVEELKERYYKIQSKLIELRTKPEEDPYHNPLASYNFNKVHETERKAQSDKLFQLSKDQVEEEQTLFQKYTNIEKHLHRHKKESKSIMKISQITINNGPLKHYSLQDIGKSGGASGSNSSSKKNKKRKLTESNSGTTMTTTEEQFPVISSRLLPRVESTLQELNIGPTQQNAVAKKLYSDLKQDIVVLLDLQKYYLEKRYHCEILKSQNEYLEKEIESLQASIPAEALQIHIEDETESAQNNTDSESQSTNTPFQIYSGHTSDIGGNKPIQDLDNLPAPMQININSNNLPTNNVLASISNNNNNQISSTKTTGVPKPTKKSQQQQQQQISGCDGVSIINSSINEFINHNLNNNIPSGVGNQQQQQLQPPTQSQPLTQSQNQTTETKSNKRSNSSTTDKPERKSTTRERKEKKQKVDNTTASKPVNTTNNNFETININPNYSINSASPLSSSESPSKKDPKQPRKERKEKKEKIVKERKERKKKDTTTLPSSPATKPTSTTITSSTTINPPPQQS
eukprot:gene2808-3491_t